MCIHINVYVEIHIFVMFCLSVYMYVLAVECTMFKTATPAQRV